LKSPEKIGHSSVWAIYANLFERKLRLNQDFVVVTLLNNDY